MGGHNWCIGRYIGRHLDRHSTKYRSSIDRYTVDTRLSIGQYISWVSTDISTDTPIGRCIWRSLILHQYFTDASLILHRVYRSIYRCKKHWQAYATPTVRWWIVLCLYSFALTRMSFRDFPLWYDMIGGSVKISLSCGWICMRCHFLISNIFKLGKARWYCVTKGNILVRAFLFFCLLTVYWQYERCVIWSAVFEIKWRYDLRTYWTI